MVIVFVLLLLIELHQAEHIAIPLRQNRTTLQQLLIVVVCATTQLHLGVLAQAISTSQSG